MKFKINTNNKSTEAELPLIYYKGYFVTLDEKNMPVHQSTNGLVKISTQKSGQVIVWYKGTLIQRVSLIISLLTLFLLIIYIITSKQRRYNVK